IGLGDSRLITENNVTYIPLRAVLEAQNYSVSWNKDNRAVIADKYGNTVAIQIDSITAWKNEMPIELNAAPKLIDARTYVSLEALTSLLGIEVDWDQASSTLNLSQAISKGYAWKVEKDGAVVHILGSIHAAND